MDRNTSDSSPSIALVLHSNILWGSGVEKTALFYIIYISKEIKNITFVQTYISDKDKKGIRLDESYLDVIIKNVKL
ncbi:MAG: hypothetical protein QW745_08545 [Thermoplasmata archaeon]